jgi:hypothetical protein
MERLFSSCTRYRDMAEFESRFRDQHPEWLQELNLDVSTESFLSAERAFTYADLYTMLGNKSTVAWMTPHGAVARPYGIVAQSWEHVDGSCRIRFKADGKVIDALARSPEHLLEICDVVVRLLAASVVHSVTLNNWNSADDSAFINAASLAYLMERCQSLKTLTLQYLALDENHCRVLGVHSRPDLEIVLIRCKLTRAGTSALVEVLGRNQGPTELDRCDVDNIVLADGLRGNSRLRSLKSSISGNIEVGNQELQGIAGAIKENKGLVDLNLSDFWVSGETWDAICDSLKTHPTLEVLDLRSVYMAGTLTPAVIAYRIQSLLEMMKVNMSIHTIRLLDRHSDHVLFRESVIPFLKSNRLRQRVRAIQKTRPIAYRTGLLGRALLSARTDVNSVWMLLSGNPEVSFLSSTATTTPAENLPEPSTAAPVNVAPIVATATAAVTVTATRAASTTGASTVDIVASPTPSTCQKRKAHP